MSRAQGGEEALYDFSVRKLSSRFTARLLCRGTSPSRPTLQAVKPLLYESLFELFMAIKFGAKRHASGFAQRLTIAFLVQQEELCSQVVAFHGISLLCELFLAVNQSCTSLSTGGALALALRVVSRRIITRRS